MYEGTTAKELIASIGVTKHVRELLVQGLKIKNSALAALSIQELARRSDHERIADDVIPYIVEKGINLEDSFGWILGKSLEELHRQSHVLFSIGHEIVKRISRGESGIFGSSDVIKVLESETAYKCGLVENNRTMSSSDDLAFFNSKAIQDILPQKCKENISKSFKLREKSLKKIASKEGRPVKSVENFIRSEPMVEW